jgi:hypothetical protein
MFRKIFVVGLFALVSVSCQCSARGEEKTKTADLPTYHRLAKISYGNGTISGNGSAFWKSGVTIATVAGDKKDTTRLVLSTAFDIEDPSSRDLRVYAITKKGKKLESQDCCSASGGGRKSEVVTLVCEFPVDSDTIESLVIEQKSKVADENKK